MAEAEFRVGAKINFLSPEEHAAHLSRFYKQFEALMRGQEGETIVRSVTPFKTDATGGTSTLPYGGGEAYRVPNGYDAFLTRLSVDYEGSNAASLVSCDLRVVADQNTPASLRSIANVVPNVFENGRSHAPMFRGGQVIVICMAGGPASTSIYCTAQVLLTPRRHISADVLDG